MKRIQRILFVILLCLGIPQMSIAQENADNRWKNEVLKVYKNLNNYSFCVHTTSTIRGIYDDKEIIDSTYIEEDSVCVYVEQVNEQVNFIGIEGNRYVSSTTKDTNITIDFRKNWITINSLQSFFGQYINNLYIGEPVHFYAEIVSGNKYTKKRDRVYDTIFYKKKYRVFEWIDSSTITNDITMREKINVFVNPSTHFIEMITTNRENNTLAELGLGAIYRVIKFSHLNINYDAQEGKEKYSLDFPHDDFLVAKENFPWRVSKEYERGMEEKRKAINDWSKKEIVFSEKILNTLLTNFDGKTIRLNDCNGWILLDTWYSNCFPCIGLMKMFSQHHDELDKRGLKVISLNPIQKPNSYLKSFCEKQGVRMDDLFFAKELEQDMKEISGGYPTVYLINPKKQVVYKKYGNDDDFSVFLEKLDEIMNQKNN